MNKEKETADPVDLMLKEATTVRKGFDGIFTLIGKALEPDESGASRILHSPRKVLEEAQDLLDRTSGILGASKEVDPEKAPKSLPTLREQAKLMNAQPKTPFGIEALDAIVGGILPGWSIVIGAFSGGGKTTFTTYMGVHFASLGHPTLMITNELSELEVANRIDQTLDTPSDLEKLSIWYPECDINGVMEQAKEWIESYDGSEQHPIVIADYLQKFRAGASEKVRERQVAVIAEAFQYLGRTTKATCILAAQLNRMSQGDEGPRLHHLRESGTIEQIADLAILINKEGDDQAKLTVAKNRWGAAGGEVILSVDWAKSRFGTLTERQRWSEFAMTVRQFILKANTPSVKIRDICNGTRLGPKHPNREDVMSAGMATGMYRVQGSDAFLT